MLNVELLDKVLDTITATPQKWDQSNWRADPAEEISYKISRGKKYREVKCGTSFCFAGWAIQLGNDTKPLWKDHTLLYANRYDNSADTYLDENGYAVIEADDRAARLLGISDTEAMGLFSGGNKLNDIINYVADIKEANL